MQYKVIPFVGSLTQVKGGSTPVDKQLQDAIQHYADQGWEYLGLESVSTFVHPDNGCFGFGGKPGYSVTKQMIVFNREQ